MRALFPDLGKQKYKCLPSKVKNAGVNAILTIYLSQGTVFWVYALHDIRLEISNAIRNHPLRVIVVACRPLRVWIKKSLAGVSVMLPSNPGYLIE